MLLVDDHALVRQGLRSLLEGYADVQVVGEAANGDEAIAAVARYKPSVVVMDINMPGLNGIEATSRIRTAWPATEIIGLSVNAGDENQEAMLRAGARRLLAKDSAVEELYNAIRHISRSSTSHTHRHPT